MHHTHWTLRELLIAVAWISVGLAGLSHMWLRMQTTDGRGVGVFLLLHLGSCAAFGIGVGTMFRQRLVGALVGLAMTPLLPCILILLAALLPLRK